MDPIALNPGEYEGSYKLIGEQLSFDLINTISWPGTEWQHDWLDTAGNFIEWALATDLITKSQARTLRARHTATLSRELKSVRSVRSDLDAALRPLAFDKQPTADAIDILNSLIHRASGRRSIDPKKLQWIWEEPASLEDILSPVIWNAARVLTETDHSRIRHCSSCHWIFYDNTRNRSRRWCDMNDCGSRDKSLRYYHRNK
jgi:predicted RNA-binding Zn ribbon-like protein